VTPDRKLSIPNALFEKLKHTQTVRVIVLINESADEKRAWVHLTAEQFLAGYSDADAIYDQLE